MNIVDMTHVSTNGVKEKVHLDNIPAELKAQRRWVVWKWKWEDERNKRTKVPVDAARILEIAAEGEEPRHFMAKSDDPHTWTDYKTACKALTMPGIDGLGFMLGDGWAGVDLDDVVQNDTLNFFAECDVRHFHSYAEISPSGTGVKILVRGQIGPGRKHGHREVYSQGRFFTLTGRKVASAQASIRDGQAALEKYLADYFPQKTERPKPKPSATASPASEDATVLATAFAAKNGAATKQLFDADEGGILALGFMKSDSTPDWSRAVSSLVFRLAYFTQDADQLDRLFRASALMSVWEDKWDRLGEDIIANALAHAPVPDEPPPTFEADPGVVHVSPPVAPTPGAGRENEGQSAGVEDEFAQAAKAAAERAKEAAERAYKFAPLSAKDFAAAKYKMSWLVKKVLVRGQPTIIGGPKKSMKTNILSDLVLSLGSGTPFLGHFEVERCRACFVSGESGEYTLQETAFRICQSKGIRLEDTDCFYDFRLPRLSVGEELIALSRGLAQRKIEVVVIDPLYLCLLSGGEEKNAANLFDMGPLLLDVAKACLDAGCQPLLTHHARKNLTNPEAALDLEDLAFAGIQEFARQWLLVNRREKYTPGTGQHELWLTAGGSVGHGGLWAVDINEGELGDDFSGRVWEPEVMTTQQAREKANLKQVAKKEVGDAALQEEFLLELDGFDEPPTRTPLQTKLGWRPDKFNRIMSKLMTRGVIVLEPASVTCGQGARRTVEVVRRA